MKITGTSACIILDIDGKKIKAEGEMVIGGFIAEKDSMKKFEPPYENEPLTETVKERYISEAIIKTKESHMIIEFV